MRRRWAAVIAAAILFAAAAAAIIKPVNFGAAPTAGAAETTDPTGIYTVARQNLSSQTQVSATLGYAGAFPIAAPSGTSSQDVAEARQTVTEEQETLSGDEQYQSDQSTADERAVAAARTTVTTARSTLSSDRATEAEDCAVASTTRTTSTTTTTTSRTGTGTGTGASSPSSAAQTGPSSAACSQEQQKVDQDRTQLTTDLQQLSTAQSTATLDYDQNQAKVATDRTTLRGDRATLAAAQATEVTPGTIYTWLPKVGRVIREDKPVYALSNEPVPLLYGSLPAYRAFYPGMSDGADVGQLTKDLIALGYGAGLARSDHYSRATASAVKRWQRALGLPATGKILLGQVVFEPGSLRVTSVTPSVGAAVAGGGGGSGASGSGSGSGGSSTVLSATSTTRQVSIALDATEQSEVRLGDKVTVTLPDNRTTPGVVSSVGTVATTPAGGGSPTIRVLVRPTHPAATAAWDQAPVDVTVTTGTVRNVLVVPVDALRAQPGGRYAVEVVKAAAVHRLVPVAVGLFDDADGLVQVTGARLHAGQRVVVPNL